MKYEDKTLLTAYKEKVEEHWYTMFDPILKYLWNIKDKKILDIWCGSGELTYELSKKWKEVVGIDLSKQRVTHCTQSYRRKNLKFFQASATDLKILKNNSFDIVIMNMVLPNIEKASDVKKIFSEVRRMIKRSGDFIFSDLHPLCIMTKEEWNRKQTYAKDFSYFKNGAKFSAIVKLPNKKEITFIDKHWTLEFYTDVMNDSNLSIKKIIESNYPSSAPKKFFRYSFPEYILFCCKAV